MAIYGLLHVDDLQTSRLPGYILKDEPACKSIQHLYPDKAHILFLLLLPSYSLLKRFASGAVAEQKVISYFIFISWQAPLPAPIISRMMSTLA